MTFIERPHENEKTRALAYVSKLLEEAISSKENRTEDIKELEEIQKLLCTKKYGLVWEHHEEIVEEEMKHNIPIFVEEENKKISDRYNSNDYNFLLEGDNLHSLHMLEKTHAGSIDVIYIDPPYNTGSKNFKYNDNFVDSTDIFSHSKWLSFMERRLKIAKRLLKDKGTIFISIDDKEFSQLKLLMDEVFGSDKFVTTIHVEMSATQGMKVRAAKNGNIVKNAEYVLVYSADGRKNIAQTLLYDYRPDFDLHYNKVITEHNQLKPLKTDFLEKYPEEIFTNLQEMWIKNSNFREYVQNNVERIVADDKISGLDINDFSEGIVTKIEKSNRSYYVINNGKKMRQLLVLSNSFGQSDDFKNSYGFRKIRGNWWKEFYLDMGNVSKEGSVVFENGKKPIRLIMQILKLSTNKQSTILDFFAGSGTTAHAVLELNKNDGGNRKFIIATNDEVIDITYKRMKNINQKLPMNLKYLKTDFLNKNVDDLEDSLLANVKTLIELKHGIDLDDSDVAIVTKKSDISELDVANLSTIYMRSQTHKMLDRKQLEELKEIKIIDIPETFFPLEMKEAGL